MADLNASFEDGEKDTFDNMTKAQMMAQIEQYTKDIKPLALKRRYLLEKMGKVTEKKIQKSTLINTKVTFEGVTKDIRTTSSTSYNEYLKAVFFNFSIRPKEQKDMVLFYEKKQVMPHGKSTITVTGDNIYTVGRDGSKNFFKFRDDISFVML